MMNFADIHCHILPNVDDGPQIDTESFDMLNDAYQDGTRVICCTPHCMPDLFVYDLNKIKETFDRLQTYAKKRYPDLELYLGNEIALRSETSQDLKMKNVLTLNHTQNVLIDFQFDVPFYQISFGVQQLMRQGYTVILAHVERYYALFNRLDWITEFRKNGGIVQVNTSSPFSKDRAVKKQWICLAKHRLIDVVASDGHNSTTRPAIISRSLKSLSRYYNESEISDLFWNTPNKLLNRKNL